MSKKNKPKLEKAKRNKEYAQAHKKKRRPTRSRFGRPAQQPPQQQAPAATIETAFGTSA